MERVIRDANYEHSVKCSTCGMDVALAALADHKCSSNVMVTETFLTAEPAQIPDEQLVYPLQRTVSPFQQQQRPPLPRLDSSLSNRSVRGLGPKEAASIAHDLGLPSPISAGTGRKSPRFPSSRKGSGARVKAGPPSPDLPISQDCAFPPFPMNKPKRANTDKDVRLPKPRSASRTNTFESSMSHSTSSSVQSSGSSYIAKRRMSGSSSNQRSRQGTIDEVPSPPSTAPTSPRRSLDSRGTDDDKPGSRGPSPALVRVNTVDPGDEDPTINQAATVLPQSEQSSPAKRVRSPFPDLDNPDLERQGDDGSTVLLEPPNQAANQEVTFDQILQGQDQPTSIEASHQSQREPAYKAKRPPPLANPDPFNDERFIVSANARPPNSPSTGGLTRTLTNLFSRKRSQSVSSKKSAKLDINSPRLRALAPDPPPVPTRGEGEFGIATGQQDSYFPPQKQSFEPETSPTQLDVSADRARSASPTEESKVEEPEKLKSEPFSPTDTGFDFKFAHSPSSHRDTNQDNEVAHSDFENALSKVSPMSETNTAVALRRTSIDSASSYGSIRYSNQTVSSRSSPPPSEEIKNKISTALALDTSSTSLDLASIAASPAIETAPDSPTDPFYPGNHLSPSSETVNPGRSQSPDQSASVESRPPPPPPPEPETIVRTPTPQQRARRPSTPAGTKGVCRGCSQLILAGQKSVSSKDGRLSGRYHKECFVCHTCREPFSTADFYVYNDHPYCGHHYHVMNNTLCAACGNGIEGQYLETFAGSSDSKKYHARCLSCAICRIQLKDDYFEFQGRIYCEKDAFRAASGPPRSPYDNAPSRPSPLVREYISSGGPGLKGRFPERRTTKLMMT